MERYSCGLRTRGGGFEIVKITQKLLPTRHFDVARPLSSAFIPRNTFVTRGVLGPHFRIHKVLRRGSFPQIAEPIVCTIPVNVVNDVGREIPRHVKPRQPMPEVLLTENANDPISVLRSHKASRVPYPSRPSNFLNVGECSGFRVILQTTLQLFLSNIISVVHKSKIKGQQREVETATDLWRRSELLQIFGMNSTSRHAFCS